MAELNHPCVCVPILRSKSHCTWDLLVVTIANVTERRRMIDGLYFDTLIIYYLELRFDLDAVTAAILAFLHMCYPYDN